MIIGEHCRTKAMLLAACAALAIMPATAHAQQGQQRIGYSIPAQGLGTALTELARQSNREIVFSADLTRGKRAPRLSGKMTFEQALDRLLKGSGLEHRVNADGSIIVEKGGNGPSAGMATGSEAVTGQDIIVTGTNIRGIAADFQPVTIYNRKQIERTGAGTTEDFLRTVPQNFSGTDAATVQSNTASSQKAVNAFSGSAINLNGLGASSTLVLLNGRRLPAAGLNGDFVDVSLIPLAAVERTEILNDGASAIYGADAIAGVVNFVLRKDYTGAETSLRYGNSTDGGGRELSASQVLGTRWSSGSAFISGNFLDRRPVLVSERSFVRDVGAGSMILPQEQRWGLFGLLRQDLWAGGQISIDGFLSRRDYSQNNFANAAGSTDVVKGNTQQNGIGGAFDQRIGTQWRASLSIDYGETRQNALDTLDFPAFAITSISNNQARSKLFASDLRLDGPVANGPSGDPIRLAVGAGYRSESLQHSSVVDGSTSSSFNNNRGVRSAYAELFVPLIGDANSQPFLRRLDVSLAGRYDDYTDFGGTGLLPKVGALWAPFSSLRLRGTYGLSFRAPSLPQLDPTRTFSASRLRNAADPDGFTNTLIETSGGRASLSPERSRSWTLGFDFQPEMQGTPKLSVSYFNVRFRNRITAPPLGGSFFTAFSRPSLVAPFVVNPVSQAFVSSIYASYPVAGAVPGGPSAIEAYLDLRPVNVAASQVSGLNVNLSGNFPALGGTFEPSFNANYLFEIKFTAAPNIPTVETVDTAFNPPDFKARGGLSWSNNRVTLGAFVNYVDSYLNTSIQPVQTVRSFTTVDLNAGVNFNKSGLLGGFRAALVVQNVFDARPPHIIAPPAPSVDLGFDPANASPLGRYISLQITKKW